MFNRNEESLALATEMLVTERKLKHLKKLVRDWQEWRVAYGGVEVHETERALFDADTEE